MQSPNGLKMDIAPSLQSSNAYSGELNKNFTIRRVYQVWKGSNKFFLGGRLIFGPDVRSFVLTVFLIVAPVIFFCYYVATPLMDQFPRPIGIAIMVAAVVFTVYDLILLLLTSARDPGIVPRNTDPAALQEDYDITNSTNDFSGLKTSKLRFPRTKDVVVNGVSVKVKYCDTCMLYRPPRCSHCSICNNCVERFDHHCPWVGQCIGKRNYPFFLMFVLSTMLLCMYVFSMSALHVKETWSEKPYSLWKALGKCPASIVLMAYTFISVWFVGGLSVFHIYLLSTNQTTYENFRYRYDHRVNPHNRGICHNVGEVFCTAIPPSKNNFRAKIKHYESSASNADQLSVESGYRASSNKRIGSDKAGWASIVGGEAMKELYGWSTDDSAIGTDNYEDSFNRAVGFLFPSEDGDMVGIPHRISSWSQKSVAVDIHEGNCVNGSTNTSLSR